MVKIIKKNKIFQVTDFAFVNKHKYECFTRNDTENGRTYNVKDLKLPSVTTILSKTQSQEKQDGLQAWRERVGYKEAQRITIEAATRGTEMHYVLENYFTNVGYLNITKKGNQARIMAHTILHNLGDLSEVWGSEVTLHYIDNDIGWAGSSDLIGKYKQKPTIIDFKQANKPKKAEWIEDYYYQIGAYSLAHKQNYGDIAQGLICMCTGDLVGQNFFLDTEMVEEYEQKWLERVKLFYKNFNTSSPKV